MDERKIKSDARKDGYIIGPEVSYLNGLPVYKITTPTGDIVEWTVIQLSDAIYAVF